MFFKVWNAIQIMAPLFCLLWLASPKAGLDVNLFPFPRHKIQEI